MSFKKYLLFLLPLVLVFSCTKHVTFLTEVEFELLEQHANRGFVNQGVETTFTVVAEAELEDYQYGMTYKLLKGNATVLPKARDHSYLQIKSRLE